MVLQKVSNAGGLSDSDLHAFVSEAFQSTKIDNKSVLLIIPDGTRSMPMATMFQALFDTLYARVSKMDYLVALGTHQHMTEESLNARLGITAEERETKYAGVGLFQHEWDNPEALTCIGTITEDEIGELSGGLLREKADVLINKRVLDYDVVCIVGPVFPHEVVGFSGGNKYFFPGVSGPEVLHLFHWLGALVTCPEIIGVGQTPVRAVVDRAAEFIKTEKVCFCLNVMKQDCNGIFFGTPEEAWEAAANLTTETHIIYKDRPYKKVLAIIPEMYSDIWVAGKGMYKLECVVEDGGELIIYAPHVTEVSRTHGEHLNKCGYHVRDFFVAQMDKYRHFPLTVLAHSTHVRGIGTFEDGIEKPRIQVTLATGVSEAECDAISLGYRDPAAINLREWENREDEGLLVVPNAGEVLYRLKEGNPRPVPLKPN